jgi:alkylation response protein AidB-like acyl-CoA dehydrogenase
MSIAITEDHLALAGTVADLLERRGSRAAARDLLEADVETLPSFWTEMAELGWMGLAVPEQFGGSGFGLPELVVVVEELGSAIAPGPFVPTVIASSARKVAASRTIGRPNWRSWRR